MMELIQKIRVSAFHKFSHCRLVSWSWLPALYRPNGRVRPKEWLELCDCSIVEAIGISHGTLFHGTDANLLRVRRVSFHTNIYPRTMTEAQLRASQGLCAAEFQADAQLHQVGITSDHQT